MDILVWPVDIKWIFGLLWLLIIVLSVVVIRRAIVGKKEETGGHILGRYILGRHWR